MNPNGVVAIYLAAGTSSRMGTNKLILPFGKTTIGSSALRAALESELDHIMVVTKQDDLLEWMDRSFFQLPFLEKWTQVQCSDAERGQAYSIKAGVQAVLDRNPIGIMVLLADQPFLPQKTINELIFRAQQLCKHKKMKETAYIAASLNGMPRPPVLFFQKLVPKLLGLEGDEGARRLLQESLSSEGLLMEFKEEIIFFDIDTKEDYRKAKKEATNEPSGNFASSFTGGMDAGSPRSCMESEAGVRS